MEVEVSRKWTVGALIEHKRKKILQVNYEYQRGDRWNHMQKRMFIDSIFRDYSIPAFYFHEKEISAGSIRNTNFDIVDGQQRIDAIYSYREGAFPTLDPCDESGFRFPNFVKDRPCPWGGKRFAELSKDLQTKLLNHKIVVYQITTTDENSIRDLFIRLQGGTPLTAQDKRDSWPGNFTEFILTVGGKSEVARWYGLPIFTEIPRISNESKRRQLAAQVFVLFWTVRKERKFCDIKSSNIDQFYHSQVGFDSNSVEAQRFKRISKELYGVLHGQPKLAGHHIIHLFLFVDSLLDEYARGWEPYLADKLHEFNERCRVAADGIRNLRETEFKRYYSEYGQLTQTSIANADTIRRRHAFFSEAMLELLAPKKLDEKRMFSNLERETVFFRDNGICQFCRMNGTEHKIAWEECQFHHVVPHADGGVTNIGNAALVHKDCHPKAQGDVEKFCSWWNETGPVHTHSGRNQLGMKRRFLPPEGTRVKFKYGDQVHLGEIRNGKLVLNGFRDGICGSFSEASRKVTKIPRSGWRDWYICLPGEENWVRADKWREARLRETA